MNFLLQAFSEANGNASSMRVLLGVVVISFAVVWVKVSWITNALAPVSVEHATIVLGAMGIKAFQKGKESAASNEVKV